MEKQAKRDLEKIEKLIKLKTANPKLPIKFMVNEDVVQSQDFPCWEGRLIGVEICEYYNDGSEVVVGEAVFEHIDNNFEYQGQLTTEELVEISNLKYSELKHKKEIYNIILVRIGV